MKRAQSLGVCIVALLALLVAAPVAATDDRPDELPYATTSEHGIPELSPDYKMTNHRVVLITDQALNPKVVTLEKGQLVAWISYSATESVVVFEREVGRKMVCHSLVNFKIQDDEIRSAPIHAGEFASFCQLQPGRYRYKVVRPTSLERDDARRRLDGEIIVGTAEPAE